MPDLPTGTVTFLFTDIEGSTRLAQAHPAEWESARQRHHAILRTAAESHQGYVFQIIGDAFCVAFHTASDALAAAVQSQQRLHSEAWGETPISARMGLHTGAAEFHDCEYHGYLTLALAQRVMSVAHGGQTLVSNGAAALLVGQLPAGITLRDMGEHRLKGILGPERLWQVVAPDLPQDFPPLPTLTTIPNNLPVQLTSFVGREKELAELKRLSPAARLLTLTGSGGVGKTRLCLQLAAETLDQFKDGVWFVELAPIADPALIPAVIASVLGLQEQADQPLVGLLSDYFRVRTSLLILDNCEHLIAESARVIDILMHAAPRLSVVTTSREALGIAGETSYRVPSLECPPQAQVPHMAIDKFKQIEAVRLFWERATQALTTFEVTTANAPAIAQICARLDGIPLAIELAAVRVKLLAPEQIATRLDDRLRILTGGSRTALPRQQTLRATVDWSYSLLSDTERALLRRLAVFAGSWSLEAAQVVCAREELDAYGVLELLAHLVDKSLVVVENRPGLVRYRMLETIRQYAREKLLVSGEVIDVRTRCLTYFLGLARAAETELERSEAAAWLGRLEDDYENFLAVLAWADESGAYEAGLEIMTALRHFWYARGHFSQACERLSSLLAHGEAAIQSGPSTEQTSERLILRSRALDALGYLSWFWGDAKAARANLRRSIAIARALGEPGKPWLVLSLNFLAITTSTQDITLAQSLASEALAIARAVGSRRTLATAFHANGHVALNRGDYAAAINFFSQCHALHAADGRRMMLAAPLSNLGFVHYLQGDYAAARSYYEQALANWREVGDKRSASTALRAIGDVLRLQGDYAAAEAYYQESLTMRRDLGSIRPIATALESLGRIACLRRDYERAAALHTESLALRREANHPRDIASSIDAFAGLAAAQGQSQRAAQLLGAAEHLFAQTRARVDPADRAERDRTIAALRVQMGEAAFDGARANGGALTLDQVIERALKAGDD